MSRRGARVGIPGLVVVLLALGAMAQQAQVPEERILYRDVRGRVVDGATGEPVPGVPVSLLYELAVTDDQGRFLFERVPLTHTAEVSLRVKSRTGIIIGCLTVDVPVRFYPVAAAEGDLFDVVIVDPGADEEVELRLQPLPDAEVDAFCETCHPDNPCVELETFQDVLKSGKDLRGIIVPEDEVEEYIERLMVQGLRKTTYSRIRYQDTHPDGMNMEAVLQAPLSEYGESYRMPEALKLREKKFVTCDTCHTRHIPTGQKQYVVMPYEEDNALCLECHQ